ncbi:MAG: glycosyltransferase [Gammaproteobacteria bacterium]|nr:glycosyltransferase [Gammaproteobacteria bacterium]
MAGEKVRLLVLTSTYPRWADDSEPAFVHELCRRLQDRFDVTVLAPHAPGALSRETLDGVAVRRYRYLPEAWETLAYDGGIPAKLRRSVLHALQVPFLVAALFLAALSESVHGRYAIVHAHWILPQGLIAVLVKRILPRAPKVVCTAHGADIFAFNSPPVRWLKSWTLRNVDAQIVVSRAMMQCALDLGARREDLHVAPMGVDVSEQFVPPAGGERMSNTVVFAGRLVEKKGLRCLIEAFAAVHHQWPEGRLIIVGDGPEREGVEQLVGALRLSECVAFTGAVANREMPSFFQKAAVAVFPFIIAPGGDREGLGLVVIEAQACACPVIASDLPAVRDSITPGETGLLVPPGDVPALSAEILKVLRNPQWAQELGRRGRESACQRFGWEQSGACHSAVLDAVLSR